MFVFDNAALPARLVPTRAGIGKNERNAQRSHAVVIAANDEGSLEDSSPSVVLQERRAGARVD